MYHQAIPRQYLIKFIYDGWCQGYEKMDETLLVTALSYKTACVRIKEEYDNARGFVNKTL
jgi:hypothetical protein